MKIIIPFRNRFEHLHTWRHLSNVLIIEQTEGKEWNREILFNIAVLETNEDYYIFNDIDMVPTRPYVPLPGVTQLAKSSIQLLDYLGGVTMFDRSTFIKAGGYHNDFWGGRAGDNEMSFNLKRLGIPVKVRVQPFILQHHERPAIEFDPVLWRRAQQPRVVQDQLSICTYKVIERRENWLKVEI